MIPSHLVYVLHADPSIQPRYAAAVASAGITADALLRVAPPVPTLPGGGLSGRYDALAASCKALTKGRSAIEGLSLKYKPPRPLGDYEHVILVTYSAGYGFARGLTALDRAMLSGLVLVDSGHGPKGLRGSALDWLIPWARAARAGQKVLAFGHTDVDPVTYASTTEVAEATIARSGGPLPDLDLDPGSELGLKRRRREGGFVVEHYNRRPPADAKAEHGDALTVWGDELVAQACAIAMGLLEAPSPEASPSTSQLPTPTVEAAFPLALSHGYRCSVAELAADARALGKLHLAADVRAGMYVPKIGDLVISARSGGDPLLGGSGHVEAITAFEPGHDPTTIGGNENNQWIVDVYRLSSPDFRAVIERDPRLGTRAVEIALAEMRAGVREIAGANHNAQIQAYHARARRGGSPIAGMPGAKDDGQSVLGEHAADEIAWCASGASYCTYRAAVALAA